MDSYARINEKTPCGGAYSEIYYFDEDGNPADGSKAFRCVIRECDENEELLNETWGNIKGCD